MNLSRLFQVGLSPHTKKLEYLKWSSKGNNMKKIILFLGIILTSFGFAKAQGARGVPTPTPSKEIQLRNQGIAAQEDISSRAYDLMMAEKFPAKTNEDNKIYLDHIKPLYRKPNKEEKELIAPFQEDKDKYAEFLRQKKTGLIKLIPEKNCSEKLNVVSSTPECLKYQFPGGGSSFSFRLANYRIQHLADVNYTGRSFRAFGVLTHGIFVNLGDLDLEKVDLQTEGIKFLAKIQPANAFTQAQELALKLDAGIKDNNFTYRNLLPMNENTTYGLRSIAYRGVMPRTVSNITYDEFELDQRKDVMVVFRVVRREAEGRVNIFWKELSGKD